MVTNNDKSIIKGILVNIEKSPDINSIIATSMEAIKEKFKQIGNKLTDDHVTFIASLLNFTKTNNMYVWSINRKSMHSFIDYFSKYMEKVCDDVEEVIINDNDSNSDNFETVNNNMDNDIDNDDDDDDQVKNEEVAQYKYPVDLYNPVQRTDILNGPYGTQWVHAAQYDDTLNEKEQANLKQFNILRQIISPEQRTPAWFKQRNTKITASDGGTVINENKHEEQYSFILKKTRESVFSSNKFCYHGTKYEEIATMIYEYRMNVKVDEFGLLDHPTIPFLGASPDGICSNYKLDKVHKSNHVGKMLEIKCPLVRKIQHSGEIKDHICPIYYWVQVQLQLECCDLDECDFWQCNIAEYKSREEFMEDTDSKEPFRSKSYGYEKGCIIQLLRADKVGEQDLNKQFQNIYDFSKFIYPPKIEMTPSELDKWVAETLSKPVLITVKKGDPGYVFNRVLYWRLIESNNTVIKRDVAWFKEKLPILDRVWKYVEFFREHSDKLKIFERAVEVYYRERDKNDKVMNIASLLYDGKDKEVEQLLGEVKIKTKSIAKPVKKYGASLFSSDEEPIVYKKPIAYKKPVSNNKPIIKKVTTCESLFSD
jgi:putative phage-type endonuclease